MATPILAPDRRVVVRVTPAQAHAWELCGGLFRAQYHTDRPYVATYGSLLGTAVHELAVAFDRSSSDVQQNLDQLIQRNWRAGRFAADDDQLALAEAKVLVAAYAAYRQTEIVRVLGSEVFCQTAPRTLGDRYALVLSGRIDRIAQRNDGTIELLDLKTGAHLPTHDELYNDPATTIYYLLAAERYNAHRIVVAQLGLRTGTRIEVSLDTGAIAAGKARLREMAHQLVTNDYSLVPSAACAYCPARATCPALLNADAATERPL